MLMLWSLLTSLTIGWPSLLPVPSSSCLCSLLHPWHSKMQLGQGVCVRACIFVSVGEATKLYPFENVVVNATGYQRKGSKRLKATIHFKYNLKKYRFIAYLKYN